MEDHKKSPPKGMVKKTPVKPTEESIKRHYRRACQALGTLRPILIPKIQAFREDIELIINLDPKLETDSLQIAIGIGEDDILGLSIMLRSYYSEIELWGGYLHELGHIFLDYSDKEAFTLKWEAARRSDIPLSDYLDYCKSQSPIYSLVWEEKPSERGFFYMDILTKPMNLEDYRLLCQERRKPCPLDKPSPFGYI